MTQNGLSALSIEQQYDLAHTLGFAGAADGVIFLLQNILIADPNHPDARNDLGALYFKLGDLEQALVHFMKAYELRPTDQDLLHNLDEVRRALAVAEVRRTLATKPKKRDTPGLPAFALRDFTYKPRSSLVAAEHAQEESRMPERGLSALSLAQQYDLSLTFVYAGVFDGAMFLLQNILVADPNHADARNDLGALYFKKGELEQAQLHLEKACELRPDDENARNNLALVDKALAKKRS